MRAYTPVSHSCNLIRVPSFTSIILAKKSTPTVGSDSYKKTRNEQKIESINFCKYSIQFNRDGCERFGSESARQIRKIKFCVCFFFGYQNAVCVTRRRFPIAEEFRVFILYLFVFHLLRLRPIVPLCIIVAVVVHCAIVDCISVCVCERSIALRSCLCVRSEQTFKALWAVLSIVVFFCFHESYVHTQIVHWVNPLRSLGRQQSIRHDSKSFRWYFFSCALIAACLVDVPILQLNIELSNK